MGLFVGSTDICVPGGLNVGSMEVQLASVGDQQTYPCNGTGLCFIFDGSKICLPFGLAGFTAPTGQPWYFELEFIADVIQISPDGSIPVWEDLSGAVDTNFDAAIAGVNLQLLETSFAGVTGTPPVVPNSLVQYENLIRYRWFGDGVSDNLQYTITNVDTAETQSGGVVWSSIASMVVDDSICIGACQRFVTDDLFRGTMQNAILVQNGVTLGHWPIQNYIQQDGTVLDISGNNNHGAISSIGSGIIGPCP